MTTGLQTERLTLRPWRDDDADAAFDLYSRWEVQRYLGRTPAVLTDRDQAVALVGRLAAAGDGALPGSWAVERRTDGAVVGAVLLKEIPASDGSPSGDVEIGWHLHPDAWGHGYATEAATAMLTHAWRLGLRRVVAVTYPQNTASQAVARRIGMTALGRTGRYYGVECALFVATAPGPAVPGRVIRDATAADAEACAAVYAPYVRDTAISFEADPPGPDELAARIARARARFAWLVAQDDGQVTGYAYGSTFRDRPAYDWSVEVTVYVAAGAVGTGAGRALYAALLPRLAALGYRSAIAVVTTGNAASAALHAACGFREVGTLRSVGHKHGAWHDVTWWQAQLGPYDDEPARPPQPARA